MEIHVSSRYILIVPSAALRRGKQRLVRDVDRGFWFPRELWRYGREVRADGDLVDEARGADLSEEVEVLGGRGGEFRSVGGEGGGAVGADEGG